MFHMHKLLSQFHKAEEYLIYFLFIGMVIVSFTQVVARYVFSSGWLGALELTLIFFAGFIFFGAVYTLRVSHHLGVSILINKLPATLQRFFAFCVALICCLYGLMIVDAGFIGFLTQSAIDGGALSYVEKMYKVGITTEDLDIPRWIVYMILPIAFSFWAWRCFLNALLIARGVRESLIAESDSAQSFEQT